MAAAAARTSLIEQKRLQWAKEREEMSRLTGSYAPLKTSSTIRTTIRLPNTTDPYRHSTYANGTRASLAEMSCGKQQPRYASTMSLRSLDTAASGISNLRQLDFASASLVDLQDQLELQQQTRRRSPSLPPICNKNEYRYQEPDDQQQCGCRQSRPAHRCSHHHHHNHQHHRYRSGTREKQRRGGGCCSRDGPEEREGETSGYASDNFDGPQQQQQVVVLPCHVNCNNPDAAMGERTWQNPYYSDESTGNGGGLPATASTSSRGKLASLRATGASVVGEFNRQRWGSVWGQETSKDPPPPSWLERGLSRLDHSSQVLVINHDSASSPDSSTTGSLGSDTNKTYLRGQNLPIDADILQEREIRRQKALELQTAIKQQLEERERKRKEEREKKLKEERDEEERIKRERDLEKQRFEEEQRRQREKEAAKAKKSKAMQEMIEAAERQAREEKSRLQQQQRKRHESNENLKEDNDKENAPTTRGAVIPVDKEAKQALNRRECSANMDTHDPTTPLPDPVRVPISQEVAIVLSGRIDDPDLLQGKSPLKLVNLVLSPSPRGGRLDSGSGSAGTISLGALLSGLGSSPVILQATARTSPRIVENRLLTPSKYRVPSGRDCGTQTDCEAEAEQESKIKESKERKEAANSSRRDIEKSTQAEDPSAKTSRGKVLPQTRASLESRPRWNANRPGTRYRTQSEKDPHYQRRMRLRRRQVETSDEGSSDFRRSPSPSRRKHGVTKAKSRSSSRRKMRLESYDADASMDSLNSLVPLHTDKNGRINIERRVGSNDNADGDGWCGEDILSHLTSLRNGLIMKKREWDLEECPISPITELY